MTIGAHELDLIRKEVGSIREFYSSRMDAEIPPMKEEVDRIASQIIRVQAMWKEGEKQAILQKYAGDDRPRVPYGKYKGLDLLDLAYMRSLLTAQIRQPIGLNPRTLEEWQANLKAALDSTTAGTGDELVDTQEARALWTDVNLETLVAPLFSRVEMPSNPFEIPLQLGDANWYPGTENLATTSTALSTEKQTLTAYELVAQVPWSLSLDEDAVIAMASEVRSSLVRNNADGATISKSDAGKGHWLIGFDGLMHLPLVDNTGQANNHGAAVSDDMFNEIRGKLGKYGVRPSELAFVTDINTSLKSLTVSNFRTLDKLGPSATLLTGQLGAVEGIPTETSYGIYFGTGATYGTNAGKEIAEFRLDGGVEMNGIMVWPDCAGPVGAADDVVSLVTTEDIAGQGLATIHYSEE